MEYVGLIILIAVAVYFMSLYYKAKEGRLPKNSQVGIRTRAIMASEEIWQQIHKKYAWFFLVAAFLFIVVGIALFLSSSALVTSQQVKSLSTIIEIIAIVIIIALSGIVAFCADKDARNLK
ncbi:SdpI family protein [Bifidobacterium sp. ESL0784]|uniref:SdpI family protein n=1 Tax=Bifidobacterium sp. ESL0784 TaxID=2983231 RepID=UPI0023FA1BE4|nr:SdpI family protein [Bifidobacterium sp. ESL0784]MDF7641666.1 SdpI family protein [Bifidobacterium sp. ESL0784]